MEPERLEILAHGVLRCAGRGADLDALDAAFVAATATACPRLVGRLVELPVDPAGPQGARALAIRTRPSELVLVLFAPAGGAPAKGDLAASWFTAFAAPAGRSPLLAMVDTTHGVEALRLRGPRAAPLLARLADASSLPPADATATRLRLADCAALLVREAADDYLLVADARIADFLLDRIAFAASGFE